MTAPSKDEIQLLQAWAQNEKDTIPAVVFDVLIRSLFIYSSLAQSVAKAKQTLVRLREAMGIKPKSERGKSDRPSMEEEQGDLDLESLSPEARELFEAIKAKRRIALNEAAAYASALKRLLPPEKVLEQLEFHLADPFEMVFSTPTSNRKSESERQKVERMQEFSKEKGLHSTIDETKRIDLQVLVTETNYEVETVTDPVSGKTVRASMEDVGPEGSTMTWRAIANLIKFVVGFAIPINRVALMIGQKEFGSSQICRVLKWAANLVLPIYLQLAEELAQGSIWSGDDTKTKVLELEARGEGSLSAQIEDHLGWTWPKANGSGDKSALNVSLLIGRSNQLDPMSTIRFFRTHLGSVGNLLTRLLEWREPKAGAVIFQGDLSSTNLPSAEMRKKFGLTLAGCGAHARRPFWRHREEDGLLCYFMLRGFLALSRLESRIDAKGRTTKNVLYYRGRFGKMIWTALLNTCRAATEGSFPGKYRPGEGAVDLNVWPPGTDLHRAAKYVINHFDELTRYLANPYLKYTNNGSERALRIEKCFLSSSKFTKTRDGRGVMDILRTINATCTAANLDLAVYFRIVYKNRKCLHENPELFTPYAVACKLKQEKLARQSSP